MPLTTVHIIHSHVLKITCPCTGNILGVTVSEIQKWRIILHFISKTKALKMLAGSGYK
jgi:hypothetical protein